MGCQKVKNSEGPCEDDKNDNVAQCQKDDSKDAHAKKVDEIPEEAGKEALPSFPYDEFASKELKDSESNKGPFILLDFTKYSLGEIEWDKMTAYRLKKSGDIYIG